MGNKFKNIRRTANIFPMKSQIHLHDSSDHKIDSDFVNPRYSQIYTHEFKFSNADIEFDIASWLKTRSNGMS